jgi:hypothetical protein
VSSLYPDRAPSQRREVADSVQPPDSKSGTTPPGSPPARDDDDERSCPDCGSGNTFTQEYGPGIAAKCRDCGWTWMVAILWTLERARAFVMPWGKYRGWTVGELADGPKGRSYLEWVAWNGDHDARIAASVALGYWTEMEGGGQ